MTASRWLLATAILAALASPAMAQNKPSGIDLAGLDKSVKPGDDFDSYANGT